MQRFITEQTFSRIFKKVYCSSHDKAETADISLQTVIEYAENLFIV